MLKKRLLVVVLGLVGLAAGGVAASVAASATAASPEIDRANTTIQVSGTLESASCTGEDKVGYVTYSGTWTGAETQMLPDPTDYNLNGTLSVSNIEWTINTQTQRGVLTGKIALVGSTGKTTYSGNLILVTQGLPAAGANIPGRGWINAGIKLPDEGVLPGDDSVIANTEWMLSPAGASGQFGDLPGSLGIPDYSVVTNVAPKAKDGVC